MKLLLDECVDQRLAQEIQAHEVTTVPEMGWAGIKNGQLLALAQYEFDVFVTVDRNLPYQQHLPKFALAVVVLHTSTNCLADLKRLIPALLAALPTAQAGQTTIVDHASL